MKKSSRKLFLSAQVKELERLLISNTDDTGLDLMHKAGLEIFKLIKNKYPTHELAIFCGSGNNAGDGYVIAKLALDAGFLIKVYALSATDMLKGDALTAYQEFTQAGGQPSLFNFNINLKNCLIIDALLGTGVNRQITGYYADTIKLINAALCPVIAVDIPSGLNADTGNIMGCAVKADWTVSFIGLKQGLYTGFAAEHCGKIIYAPLDVSQDLFKRVDYAAKLIRSPSLPKRHRCAHKGNNGHVLVIGGDAGFSGAARLAAEAALRIGSGLASVATRKSHVNAIGLGRPEIMCHAVGQENILASLLNKATVIVVGPGLGQTKWASDLLQKALNSNKPLVCDADALNFLAKNHIYHKNWILTPHPGEAARLLNCSTEHIANDRFKAVAEIQKKYGGVVVLKGAGTLINNGHKTSISKTGNPGMASGGMGDVLAGMVGGLIAQGLDLHSAAKAATYLHGKAADLSAQKQGEIGMLASDLMPFIRKLVNR